MFRDSYESICEAIDEYADDQLSAVEHMIQNSIAGIHSIDKVNQNLRGVCAENHREIRYCLIKCVLGV